MRKKKNPLKKKTKKKPAHHPSGVDRSNMHHQSQFKSHKHKYQGEWGDFMVLGLIYQIAALIRIRKAICDLLMSLNLKPDQNSNFSIVNEKHPTNLSVLIIINLLLFEALFKTLCGSELRNSGRQKRGRPSSACVIAARRVTWREVDVVSHLGRLPL